MSAIVKQTITTKQSDKKMTQRFVEKNEHFAKNSQVENGISLCIPRMFNNIGHRRVKGVFLSRIGDLSNASM